MTESLNDKLEAFFKARPNIWVDGKVLATVAGGYAWRSRCSDLRKRGLTIENRQRTDRTHRASCPALQAWDIPGACNCDVPRYTVSEYRYVPESSIAVRVDADGQAAFL